jgi:hypothetical protein
LANVFNIHGLDFANDLFGIWQISPLKINFSAFNNPPFDTLVYSVTLDNNLFIAEQNLQQQIDKLNQIQTIILQAEQNFKQLSSSINFTYTSNELQILQADLLQLQNLSNISFSSSWWFNWKKTISEYNNFVSQTLNLLKPTLFIESKYQNKVIAFTKISIDGDLDTVWQNTNLQHRKLHHKVINTSLNSRLISLQLLTKISLGAIILTSKFALPNGYITAIPAIWRYFSMFKEIKF